MKLGFIIISLFIIRLIFDSIAYLIGSPTSTDLIIFQHYNLIFVGYILNIFLLFLCVSSLYAIVMRKKFWIKLLYIFSGVFMLLGFVHSIVWYFDGDFLKKTMVESRVRRWLPPRDDISNQMFLLLPFFSLLMFWLIIYYVNKQKEYFKN